METSESVVEITKALLTAWESINNLSFDKEGYTNKYTTLMSIIDHVKPILLRNNILCMQTATGGNGENIGVCTRLQHVSGEFFEDTCILPQTELSGKASSTQKIGASITYGKRYHLTSMLFMATGDDIDPDAKHDELPGVKTYTIEQAKDWIGLQNWTPEKKNSIYSLCKKSGEAYIRKVMEGEIK